MSFQIAGTLLVVLVVCMMLAVINNIALDGTTLSDRIDKVLEIVGLSSLACAVISAAVGIVLWIW